MTEPVDVVTAAVLRIPGVASLHAGMYGEVGTYLPGRLVSGVRINDGVTDVHASLVFGPSVRETAAQIRDVVAEIVGGTVNVTVEDIAAPAARGGPSS